MGKNLGGYEDQVGGGAEGEGGLGLRSLLTRGEAGGEKEGEKRSSHGLMRLDGKSDRLLPQR